MNKLLLVLIISLSSLNSFFLSGEEVFTDTPPTAPLGLPPIIWPANNLYTKEKAVLGRILFYDKRLSSDETISCAHCHDLPAAFTDPEVVSIGVGGKKGTRNAPTVINSGYLNLLFWDGRAASLEEQCHGPLGNPVEMTNVEDPHLAHQQCCERVSQIEGYKPLFKAAFGDEECNLDRISQALATFERTILSGNSRYDRYLNGEKTALTAQELAGWKVFNKSSCIACHNTKLTTDGKFYNIGIGMDRPDPDLGRYVFDKKDIYWGAFKTPTLRDTALSGPYFHDGSAKTLEEVVEYYNKGGIPNKNLDPMIRPLHLTEADKAALVAFMKALSGEGWQHAGPPNIFPE